MSMIRTKWAAVGAALAVTLGAGGVSLTQAAIGSGEKPVFVPIEPCRLIDTRPANQIGPKSTPLGPNETITLQVTGTTGECTGIPADATGAAMNMTAIQPTAQSFLTVYPSDGSRPNASNLNWAAGDPPTPNKVDVKLGADGAVKVYNSVGTVHLAADLVGYYIDHHHDDRYYTEAEVDALTEQIYVAIDNTGGIYQEITSGHLTASSRVSTGTYDLTFNRTVEGCAAATADILFANMREVSADTGYGADPNGMRVVVRDQINAVADTWFYLILMCPRPTAMGSALVERADAPGSPNDG